MNIEPVVVYPRIVGFRASEHLDIRLRRFSSAVGRHRSDVIRYLLISCLNAYEANTDAIAKIRQELY
jgi:hypothetical protein